LGSFNKLKNQGEYPMSSVDPIEGVSAVSSVSPHEPGAYNTISSPSERNTSSIESMAKSGGMSDKEAAKFVNNAMKFAADQEKTDEENLKKKMEEAIQALNQA
jgi:hypothetical protein